MRLTIAPLVLSFAALAATPGYQAPVRKFAGTLLAKGLDVYGSKRTPLWAGVIDARTLAVPEKGVPAPRGLRENDRAVGGANLYHDARHAARFPRAERPDRRRALPPGRARLRPRLSRTRRQPRHRSVGLGRASLLSLLPRRSGRRAQEPRTA